MIEILKLDTETDVCVLPLCHCQLSAAGWPDGKGHSQRALFTLLPLYWLSLIISITMLMRIIHYWSTLRLGKQGLVGVNPYCCFQTRHLSPHSSDKICYYKDREHLQFLTYQIWECTEARSLGGAQWFNIGMSLRASATAIATYMWIEQPHVYFLDLTTSKWFPALHVYLCMPEGNNSKTHHASLKKKKKDFLKVTPLWNSSVCEGDDSTLLLTVCYGEL